MNKDQKGDPSYNPYQLSNFNYLFKFLLIGDVGVGKSAIIHQYTQNHFLNEYEPTIGVEFGSRMVQIDGNPNKLDLSVKI
jgi:Ras-related protein Rab-14